MLNSQGPTEAQRHTFDEIVPAEATSSERLSIEDLRSVRLPVTAELGQAVMLVRDVLALKQGATVTLNREPGDPIDLCVNGVPLAKGEVKVAGGSLHVRVAEILGAVDEGKEPPGDEH